MVQTTSNLIFATVALSAAFVAGAPSHGFADLALKAGRAGAKHAFSSETKHALGESAINGAFSLGSSAIAAHQQNKMAKQMMQQQQMAPGRRDVEDDLFSFSRRDFEVISARGPGMKGEKGEGSHRRKNPRPSKGNRMRMQNMQPSMQGGQQQEQQEAPQMQQQMAGRDLEELYDFEARELEDLEARGFLEKAGSAAIRHGASALAHHGPSLIEGGANLAGQAIQAKSQARMMMMPQVYRRDEEEFWARSYEDFDELD